MDSSLQHLIEQMQQKKAQADANYNDMLNKLNCLANGGSSIPNADIMDEIAKASVLYQAIVPFVGDNGRSQPVNNQEMSGVMQNAVLNALQVAQQPTDCSTGNCQTNDSPSNAEKSLNLSQFISHSNSDYQIHIDQDEIAIGVEQIGHVDAEDDGNGNLEEGKRIDNMENEVNNHYDCQESHHEGSLIHFENQVRMNGVDDNGDAEEEHTAGPSTSNHELSSHPIVPNRQLEAPSNAEKTEVLSVITKKYKCHANRCKKWVKSKRGLNRHLLLEHKQKAHRCLVEECYGRISTSFTTLLQLEDHYNEVHLNLTKYTCWHCFKKINSLAELIIHFRNYHELGLFACSKEGCTFKPTRTRSQVLLHQAMDHPDATFKCPFSGCDKSFNETAKMNRHYQTHTDERTFVCPECDESFKRKQHLTTHLRIHQNDKCFRCTWPQCNHSATDGRNVIMHIRVVHFKLPQTKKEQDEKEIIDDRDPRDYLAKD